MVSNGVPFGLLVILGAMLTAAKPTQFISNDLKDIHDSIANDLDLKQPAVGSKPLFNSVINAISTSCQRKDNIQLMNTTLDVYMRIFSSILSHSHHNRHHHGRTQGLLDTLSDQKRSEVEEHLRKLQDKMKDLKTRLTDMNQAREIALSKLENIKVNDPGVQKRALAQFLEIYQAASVIDCCNC